MKVDLKEYLEERERVNQSRNIPGPVVTVSRQFGCNADEVVELLISRINDLPSGPLKRHPWKFISKEIIEGDADELDFQPLAEEATRHSEVVNELVASLFQSYDISDTAMVEKVKDILMTYAKVGNMIIIGRGGRGLIKDVDDILHIRLIAPQSWRVKNVAIEQGISEYEALELVQQVDDSRTKWMEHVSGEKFDTSFFDITFNMSTIRQRDIVDLVVKLMQQKGMIPGMKLTELGTTSIKN